MKRYGYLYEHIFTWENLLLAFKKARKGKHSVDLEAFTYNWENQLLDIQTTLQTESFKFKPYRQFKIYEPKERLISCAPFCDRVVHHAICNVILPYMDKSMVVDSYACRKNKGLHKAVKRAYYFYKNTQWHYRLDIQKYYYNIDHDILYNLLNNKFKDIRLLDLLKSLLETYDCGTEYYTPFPEDDLLDIIRNRGLPIGNLTSQLFANYYLNGLDHYIREELHFPYYIRYMDDIIVFGNDRKLLQDARERIIGKLRELKLQVNEKQDCIRDNKHGINWLGFRLYGNKIKLCNRNLVRLKRNLKLKSKTTIRDFRAFLQSVNGCLGYLKGGHTKELVNKIFDEITYSKSKGNFKLIYP